MVARSAGGREVAGSNPVTPIPWQGHGRRSDPSGGLRKRETVYCGVSFLCNRKLRSYYIKNSSGIALRRRRKMSQERPAVGGESCRQDSYLFHRKYQIALRCESRAAADKKPPRNYMVSGRHRQKRTVFGGGEECRRKRF